MRVYCGWTLNADKDGYSTGCSGKLIYLGFFDTLEDSMHRYVYCPYCGSKIKELPEELLVCGVDRFRKGDKIVYKKRVVDGKDL